MGLLERLTHEQVPHIPAHAFMAALAELERGKMSRAQVLAAFGIAAEEEADLDALAALTAPEQEPISLGGYTICTNIGATFDATGPAKGLGFVRLEGRGITGLEWTIRWNKVGTGTLSWQLWDDTTGAEVALHEDTAAAGDNRQQVVAVVPPAPLAAGLHTLRVRGRSTVATDDPVYYGSALRVRRAEALSAPVLHEVLLLADARIAPVADAIALRARLGL